MPVSLTAVPSWFGPSWAAPSLPDGFQSWAGMTTKSWAVSGRAFGANDVVYWAGKDNSYGMKGKIIGKSLFYGPGSILVSFKGVLALGLDDPLVAFV